MTLHHLAQLAFGVALTPFCYWLSNEVTRAIIRARRQAQERKINEVGLRDEQIKQLLELAQSRLLTQEVEHQLHKWR